MDRLVTLKEKVSTVNDFGEEIAEWQDVAQVWAERLELRGGERWNAQQVVANITCKYRIRWRDDVGPLDRLADADGREYDIHAALELGRREGLELLVAARGE
jgi:SPP1 family predicted phage head-tail adaptor